MIRHEDKIIGEVRGSERVGEIEGKNASSRLFFAVNASRGIPTRKRERNPTKPALFELSFASPSFLPLRFSFERTCAA